MQGAKGVARSDLQLGWAIFLRVVIVSPDKVEVRPNNLNKGISQ